MIKLKSFLGLALAAFQVIGFCNNEKNESVKRKEGFFDSDQRPEIFRNSGRELVKFQIFSSYSKQKVFNDMFISPFSSLLFILHLSDTGTLVLLCRSTGNHFKNGDLSTDFSKKKFLKIFLEHLQMNNIINNIIK